MFVFRHVERCLSFQAILESTRSIFISSRKILLFWLLPLTNKTCCGQNTPPSCGKKSTRENSTASSGNTFGCYSFPSMQSSPPGWHETCLVLGGVPYLTPSFQQRRVILLPPKNALLQGTSLKMRVHFYCLIPPQNGSHLMTPDTSGQIPQSRWSHTLTLGYPRKLVL